MYVVNGYPSGDWPLRSDVVPNPASLYGATKAWGEALGSYYAYQQGLSVLCLRLGMAMARDDHRMVNDLQIRYEFSVILGKEAQPFPTVGVYTGVAPDCSRIPQRPY